MSKHNQQIDDIKAKRKAIAEAFTSYVESAQRFRHGKLSELVYYWRNDLEMKALLKGLDESMIDDSKHLEGKLSDIDFELKSELRHLEHLDDQQADT
ncbi:MAG: hypothetical protein FWH40_02555 [Coriobacteriia bacterium]|nr:hypothetical protein [Coriobacteriia bacterium]